MVYTQMHSHADMEHRDTDTPSQIDMGLDKDANPEIHRYINTYIQIHTKDKVTQRHGPA